MVRWIARLGLALAWIAAVGLSGRAAAADSTGPVIVIRGTEVSAAPGDIGERVRAGGAQVEVIRPKPAPVQAAAPSSEGEPDRQVVLVYLPGYAGYDWDDSDSAWEPWPWTTGWGFFRHRHHFHGDKVHHFDHFGHAHHHPHGFTHAGHGRFPNGFGAAPMHGSPMRAAGHGFGR